MVIYLLRHGKDDAAVRGGWSKSGLTDEGLAQVGELVGHIAAHQNELAITRIVSSDLPRTIQTSMPISDILDINIELKPDFRETNNGVFAGMKNEIANEKYPGLFWNTLAWNESYPQGESPCAFYQRIKTSWTQFSHEVIELNQNVLLVTHGGVINVIFSLIDGLPYSNKSKTAPIPHATLIPIQYENGIWKIMFKR